MNLKNAAARVTGATGAIGATGATGERRADLSPGQVTGNAKRVA
ncbi:MAG TPA: hypothetical protein VGL08_11010 [Paraburkholderia sp.]|jgi:hypothetical protein